MPRRPWNGTRFPGNMRTSSTSTIMPRHTIWIGIASPCSTVTQRPSFRWVLSRGKSCGSNCDWTSKQQVNNVNITLNPLSLSPSLSSSLHTGPTIVISRRQLQRRPTLTQPTTAMLQLMWRQRRDSLWRAPRSPATIRPPTPRQVGCAPSPRPTRAQVSRSQHYRNSQLAARNSCATCQICCSISVLTQSKLRN